MNPESVYYLSEADINGKQEDYMWPVAGEATVNDKVFVVCDVTGSFNPGETASKYFCEFMATKVLLFAEQKMSGELIDKILYEARDRLMTYARIFKWDSDLAATFSMLILYDKKVLMSSCGDSRIYHLRGGKILFRNEGHSLVSEPTRNTSITHGIEADSSPIHAETKWIGDVQDGDYFLLCGKGIKGHVTDDDIELLVSQNDKANIDPTGSYKRLSSETTPDNCSMYLIRVDEGTKKISINSKIIAIRKQTSENVWPIFILALTIVGLLTMVFYFRKARTYNPEPHYINRTTQPADVLREDSVPNAIVMSAPRKQPVDVPRDDSVSSAIVVSATRKPILTVTDSVKNIGENPQAAPQKDNSAAIQSEEKPEQTNRAPIGQKKRVAQLLIKLTTDESCKLKITNIDLNEVIDWDLSPNDNGTIYLKPGSYSIVATSVVNSSKTQTYNFDVKSGYAQTRQNLHIRF